MIAARFLVLLLGASLKGTVIFGPSCCGRAPRWLRHLLWLGALSSYSAATTLAQGGSGPSRRAVWHLFLCLAASIIEDRIQPDRTVEAWVRPDSPRTREYSVKLRKTWVDAEGATLCQFFFTYIDGTKYQGQGLIRVDKARKVLEWNKKFGKEGDLYPERSSGRTQARTDAVHDPLPQVAGPALARSAPAAGRPGSAPGRPAAAA